MKSEDLEKKLFVAASEDYGDKYIEHLLEQYKVYVASAEKISSQRQKTNEFFLAVNTALVAFLGFITTKTGSDHVSLLLAVASLAGIIMCYLWYRIVRSYDGLNDGKYKVIHAIEKRLPMALYDAEWEMLGRGKQKDVYWPFTHIERLVPWLFMAIYVLLLLVTVLY
jgi:sensor c-di-GMP phosphodiesterase-like protein